MKKFLFIALAATVAVTTEAQSVYDAGTIGQRDLNGTARFVGMGGALGALGGDISTIGTNPAGIGIYRSNDAMVSFGYSITSTESDYVGNVFEADKNRWNFDNAGVVISTKVGNLTALRYVNFGFNYHKAKSLYRNMSMAGFMGTVDNLPLSQVRYMAQQATNCQAYLSQQGESFNFGSNDIFTDADAGWLGAMGYQGWLTDEGGSPYYMQPYLPTDEVYSSFFSRERGGIDQYDFNVSFNLNDRVYFGLTVGAYDVDYRKESYYGETFNDQEHYDLGTFKRIHGAGFNAKFGIIARPFEYSSLRVGLAVHTPTYYDLTYTTGANLQSTLYNNDGAIQNNSVDTYSALGNRDVDMDFQLETPWVVNASLGYTVGSSLALGAEYEYENFRSMKFKENDGYEMSYENNEVDLCLKGVHTMRLGAEWKVIPSFSLRVGYNYSTALYEKNAVKYLPDNSVATDTDFTNSYGLHTGTMGFGYRASAFYVDLAYKFQTQKADFYPFFNELSYDDAGGANPEYVVSHSDYTNGNYEMATSPATKITNSRSQVILTLGFRF